MADYKNIFSNIDDYFMSTHMDSVYTVVIGVVEKMLIEKALERFSGNQIEASKMLGIHRNTLHSKIKKLNIDITKYKL